jgi:hypothetical protein
MLTQHSVVLLLFIQLDNFFILFNFSSSAEALSASAVACCRPSPTPWLTTLHPPPSLLNACAQLAYPGSWSALTVSFFDFLCIAGMAAIVAVPPSQMADCCVFFITCTPSTLSSVLYHAIAGSCNVESHLRKSSINPSSANFNPTARP